MESVVISLGGSVLTPAEPDPRFLRRLARTLRSLARARQLFVVTGGGRTARAYIEAGRTLGAPERFLDRLGIEVTRLNARLLLAALGGTSSDALPTRVEDAVAAGKHSQLVVMGGTTVGHTTDAVAAEIARTVGAARLVNATSVDGVYTADPTKDPAAKRLDRVTYAELVRLSGKSHARAGPSIVFDPKAARIVAKARIPVAVVRGRDLEALRRAVLGEPFAGTIVG